eukprot:4913231-Prymnesium_polylepis.1
MRANRWRGMRCRRGGGALLRVRRAFTKRSRLSLWVVVGGDSLYRVASCLDSVDMLDVAEG